MGQQQGQCFSYCNSLHTRFPTKTDEHCANAECAGCDFCGGQQQQQQQQSVEQAEEGTVPVSSQANDSSLTPMQASEALSPASGCARLNVSVAERECADLHLKSPQLASTLEQCSVACCDDPACSVYQASRFTLAPAL